MKTVLAPTAAVLAVLALGGCGMMGSDDRSLVQGQDLRIWGDPVTIVPGPAMAGSTIIERRTVIR